MARILVIGASRGIGAEVARQALAAGHFVRAMSRSGTVPPGLKGDCEAFAGDALETADIANALNRIDTVVQSLGIPLSLDMVLKPVTLFSRATQVLLPAMESAGVTRLMSVTGFGAGDSSRSINCLQRIPFNLIFGHAYADKSVQEKLIAEATLDWLIVRPGVLTNGARSECYKVLSSPKEWRNGIISRADVAHFIVGKLASEALGRIKPVLIRYQL